MIKVFSQNSSTRLRYTLEFITLCTQVEFDVISDIPVGNTANGKLLNYSTESIAADVCIHPSAVLSEKGIHELDIKLAHYRGEPCFNIDGTIDPLATIFLILSRYEEYLPFKPDKHNRFSASNSCLQRFGILHKMVCDRLAFAIVSEFNPKEIALTRDNRVEIAPTFDIDNAFAYLLKGKVRGLLSLWRDRVYKQKERLTERREVLRGTIKDPYDTYSVIATTAKRGFQVRMFWLLGNYGPFDKNISWKNKSQHQLIQRCSSYASIGIHPSYASENKAVEVLKETNRLQKITESVVNASRQHFLRLRFPDTYRSLIQAGIKEDYTMGYADDVGFRAGTSRVFPWFDLSKNERTELMVHPFAYMDGTLNEYLQLTPEDAMHIIRALYEEIALFGGNFAFIWHNETLNNRGKWKGWKEVFNYSLNLAQKEDG